MHRVIYIFFICVLGSCVTNKKAVTYFDKNRDKAAEYCADRFPVIEKTDTVEIVDSTLLRAYEEEHAYMVSYIDSIISIKCDSSAKREIITVIKDGIKPKPIVKYVTRVVENTARVQALRDSCDKLSSNLYKKLDITTQNLIAMTDKSEKYKKQRNQYLWFIILLLAILFRKPIARGAKKLITKI